MSHQLPQQQMTGFPEVTHPAEVDLQSKSKPSTLLGESCKLHTAFISASVCKGVVTEVLLAYHEIMAETQKYARHYTEVQHVKIIFNLFSTRNSSLKKNFSTVNR